MEKTKEGFNYEAVKQKFLEQFRTGKSLLGKDEAFGPMLQDFLNTALEAEGDLFLNEGQRRFGNRKNGYNRKQLKTSDGTIELTASGDRDGEFEPQIVPKRETILADQHYFLRQALVKNLKLRAMIFLNYLVAPQKLRSWITLPDVKNNLTQFNLYYRKQKNSVFVVKLSSVKILPAVS